MLFMLARPDWARIVEEFEAIHDPPPSSTGHHEDGRGLQATFRKDISSFVKVVGQLGNPFVATSLGLVALDTQNVMEESVVASLSWIREVGQTPHATYVRERLEDSSVPISDIIKRNNILTFANRAELRKKPERMSAYSDITWAWLRSYSYHRNRVQPTWLISSGLKTRESHRTWLIEGHCELERSQKMLQCLGTTTGRVAAAQQPTVVVLDMATIIHMAHTSKDVQWIRNLQNRAISGIPSGQWHSNEWTPFGIVTHQRTT